MKTRIQKWGNSLAVRIPKSFAAEMGLDEHVAVDLSIRDGRLVVQPQAEDSIRIEDLLEDITDENIHGEWETGPAVGKEIW